MSEVDNNMLFSTQEYLQDITKSSGKKFINFVSSLEDDRPLDHFVPYMMSLMLCRRITVYAGAQVWSSDDDGDLDIVLALVGRTFVSTKVGKLICHTEIVFDIVDMY